MMEIFARTQQKRDTHENFLREDIILMDAETAIVDFSDGTIRKKTGDGISPYSQLKFDDEYIDPITGRTMSLQEILYNFMLKLHPNKIESGMTTLEFDNLGVQVNNFNALNVTPNDMIFRSKLIFDEGSDK